MDDFEIKTIKLAVLITFVTIIFIFISLYYSRKANKGQWPPETQQCPDYWRVNEGPEDPVTKKKSMHCVDVKGLTSNRDWNRIGVNLDEMSKGEWKTLCDKQVWANKYNLTWDGVTNSSKDCSYKASSIESGDIYSLLRSPISEYI
jgi:hypothetical protein